MKYPIHQLLKLGKEILLNENIPEIEAKYYLEKLLDMPFHKILTELDKEVDSQQVAQYQDMLNQRISGLPMQHIIGHEIFMDRKFQVNQHVLIPRPETEWLVHRSRDVILKDEITRTDHTLRIMDLCTGSGCIAISLICELADQGYFGQVANVSVIGVDISDEALKVANANAEAIVPKTLFQQGVLTLDWKQSDLFKELHESKFHMIISNPPYIPPYEIETLSTEVKDHEPMLALDGGPDGLDFYRRIVDEGLKYLEDGGWLMFEIGHGQMADVMELMTKGGFVQVSGIKDFNELERNVVGRKPIQQ